MVSSRGFTFKQFHIEHDACAMKVGTDGILLGAWSEVGQAQRILDIGTGSGLIALQLAQRAQDGCHITALELDPAAAAQATRNVAASPWPDKITVKCQSLQAFTDDKLQLPSFDLIVSNPPYFPAGQNFDNPSRALARHNAGLGKVDLIKCLQALLSPQGRCDLVLPLAVALAYIETAQQHGLHLVRRVDVQTKASKPAHRMLFSLSKQPALLVHSQLTIHDTSGAYSAEFIRLTSGYYLKM